MRESAIRNVLMGELRRKRGSCSQLADRIRDMGIDCTEDMVHRELRRLVDVGAIIESVTPPNPHKKVETGVVVYEG